MNASATGWLYHPFASGLRDGIPSTVGADASYLIVSDAEPAFPALSVQEPVTAAAAPSGPPYVPDVHDATPDAPSSPEKLNADRARVPAVRVRTAGRPRR